MLDATILACWPACVDALHWSADGIIAFASDEKVELLFPQTESKDIEQDTSAWLRVSLPVSWFTPEELPDKEPAPFATYSVGEEVSTSAPVSIAWSPPGIAKHRRCALGVLTSSLVLSVWACYGKTEDDANWKRKLIINDALVDYFYHNVNEVESILVNETVEKMRLRARIRCFSWAPSLPSPKSSTIIGTQPKWGQPIVAVANDDNQVAFVAIDSPTTTLGAEQEWTSEVLNHFSVIPESEIVFVSPSTFDEMMQQQRHVSHMAWSPWTVQGDWHHSVLVYATNEDVRARVVTYSGETIGFCNDEIVYPDIQLRFAGPMEWSPRVEDGDKVTLALFTSTNVTILTISASDAKILDRTEHHLDGRWHEMSGAAWDFTGKDPTIHFSSLHETLNNTTGLKLSNNELCPTPQPHWYDQLSDSQALFSAQHELKGNARTKVWGLSISPLSDFIATCSTVHPSDMIEYGPPNERRTSIAITRLRNHGDQTNIEVPLQNFTAEGFAFMLRKWLESTGSYSEPSASTVEEITNNLFNKHWTPKPRDPSDSYTLPTSPEDFRHLIDEVKKDTLLNKHTTKDRCTILISQTCSPSTPKTLPRTLIAYRLATATQSLPKGLALATPFSAEIHEHHRQVVALINSVMRVSASPPQDPSQNKTFPPPCDTCDLCHADIPLTDLTSASCTNGHPFPRCGISFLAIQAPRISKYCGLCGTPFLSEEFVRLQEVERRAPGLGRQAGVRPEGLMTSVEDAEMGGQVNGEGGGGDEGADGVGGDGDGDVEKEGEVLPVSLARVLFLACDVCIYCGGKFTG